MNEDFTQSFYVPPQMAKRLGWICHDGYLPALEEERFPIEHTPPAPVQDFYLLGRMAYLQHEVEILKKGYQFPLLLSIPVILYAC